MNIAFELIKMLEAIDFIQNGDDVDKFVSSHSGTSIFKYVCVTGYLNNNFLSNKPIRFSSFPSEWHAFVERSRKIDTSGLKEFSHETNKILPWSVVHQKIHPLEVFYERSSQYGVDSNGFSIVCPVPGNQVCSFFCKLSTEPADFDTIIQLFGSTILRIGQRLSSKFAQINGPVQRKEKLITKRELEALTKAANGLLAKQIAQQMGVTIQTVNMHLVTSRNKLAARNTTHAVSIAIALGLIDLAAIEHGTVSSAIAEPGPIDLAR